MQSLPYLTTFLAGLSIAIIRFYMLKLAATTDLIKDLSIQHPRPYSLASSQLFWWTAIIISCFTWQAFTTGSLPILNPLALLLLGISAATTLSGKVIDNADRNTVGDNRHQDRIPSKGFFHDILSDLQGNSSIHRLQTILFNIIIGFTYIIEFINTEKFPEWDNGEGYITALLGISNAGYIALKNTENAPSKIVPPPPGGGTPPNSEPLKGGAPVGRMPTSGPGPVGEVGPVVAVPVETIVSATELNT